MGACHSAQSAQEEAEPTSAPVGEPTEQEAAKPAVPDTNHGSGMDTVLEVPASVAGPSGEPAVSTDAEGRRSSEALRKLVVNAGPPLPQGPCHDSASSHPGSRCSSTCNDDSRRSSLEYQRSPCQKRRTSTAGVPPPKPAAPWRRGTEEERDGASLVRIESMAPVLIDDTPPTPVAQSPFESAIYARRSLDIPEAAPGNPPSSSSTLSSQPSLEHRTGSLNPELLQGNRKLRASQSGPLNSSSNLEAAAEPGIERILGLCASVFRCDAVLLVLRDGGRQFRRGGEARISGEALSQAAAALEPPNSNITHVEDTAAEPRLAGAEGVRREISFFAATALVASNGYRLGSLCIAHSGPHTLDVASRGILRNMAELLVRELWGVYQHEHQQRVLQLIRVVDCYSEPHAFVEVSETEPWKLLSINAPAQKVTGLEGAVVAGKPFWDIFCGLEESNAVKQKAVSLAASAGGGFALGGMRASSTGIAEAIPFTLVFRPAARESSSGGGDDKKGTAKPRALSNAGRRYYFVGVRIEAEASVTSAAERTPFPGLQLGALLGRGSYGRVYKGYYHGRVIAVKVCDRGSLRLNEDGVPIEEVTMHLRHPNLVQTLDSAVAVRDLKPQRAGSIQSAYHLLFPGSANSDLSATGRTPDTPASRASDLSGEAKRAEETWLLLEYCDMGSLMEAVERGWFRVAPDGPPNFNTVLASATELAAGMAYLHSQGMVHGDLSSGNVLLMSSAANPHGFKVKVTDFGLARQMDFNSRIQTQTSGTVGYMAVEVLSEGIISKAADVYSFGVLLYEMVAGKRAWHNMMPSQIMLAITLRGQKLAFPDSCLVELAKIGNACMDSDPAKRPTFEEAHRSLSALRAEVQKGLSLDARHRAASCPA